MACGTCHRPNELTALAVVTAYDQGVLAEKTARKTVPSVPVSRFVSFWTAGLQYPLKHILRLRRARTWAGLGCRFTSCWVEGQWFLWFVFSKHVLGYQRKRAMASLASFKTGRLTSARNAVVSACSTTAQWQMALNIFAEQVRRNGNRNGQLLTT